MDFNVNVKVTVVHQSGKFCSREDVEDAVMDGLDRGGLSEGDELSVDDSTYLVESVLYDRDGVSHG